MAFESMFTMISPNYICIWSGTQLTGKFLQRTRKVSTALTDRKHPGSCCPRSIRCLRSVCPEAITTPAHCELIEGHLHHCVHPLVKGHDVLSAMPTEPAANASSSW